MEYKDELCSIHEKVFIKDISVDIQSLLQSKNDPKLSFVKRHPYCLCIIAILCLIILGQISWPAYSTLFMSSSDVCTSINIMDFNTWGMPKIFGSKYKNERMKAIAQEFSKGKYDIYLFQELWMESDHETIAREAPPGYTMTGFR